MSVPPIVSKAEIKRRLDRRDKQKPTETQNKLQSYTKNIHPKRAKVNTQKEKQAKVKKIKSFAGIN
jgi:hypothetical protein